MQSVDEVHPYKSKITSKLTQIKPNQYILNKGAPLEIVLSNAEDYIVENLLDMLSKTNFYDDDRVCYALCYYMIVNDVKCNTFELISLDHFSKFQNFFDDYNAKENVAWNDVELASIRNEAKFDYIKSNFISDEMLDLLDIGDIDLDDEDIESIKLISITMDFIEDMYYLRFLLNRYSDGSAECVTPDDFFYGKWLRAVKDGYATRGYDIPVSKLVTRLNMKQINEMFSDVLEKKFNRLQAAKDFAVTHKDFKSRFFNSYSSRELFCLNFNNQKSLLKLYENTLCISKLIVKTILVGERSIEKINYYNSNSLILKKCNCCASKSVRFIELRGIKTFPPYYLGCECDVN